VLSDVPRAAAAAVLARTSALAAGGGAAAAEAGAGSGVPLVVYGLLQHEAKLSVLNFGLKKAAGYGESIRNKEQLLLVTGVRRCGGGAGCPLVWPAQCCRCFSAPDITPTHTFAPTPYPHTQTCARAPPQLPGAPTAVGRRPGRRQAQDGPLCAAWAQPGGQRVRAHQLPAAAAARVQGEDAGLAAASRHRVSAWCRRSPCRELIAQQQSRQPDACNAPVRAARSMCRAAATRCWRPVARCARWTPTA
jgi:hypothetical protein